MKRPTLIASGSLDRLLQAAEAAWGRKDFSECIETLQRASHLAPSNTDILLRLGQVQGLRYDYVAAERCFEQALRIAPRKTEMLTAIVNHCQNFRNSGIPERFLRRALEQPDVTPVFYVALAEIYERLRRRPEVAELVERALQLHPAFPAALLVRARLERLAGKLESAESVLRSFITRPQPNSWVLAQAWYELATVLDRQEKFDDAMAALLTAKKLQQPQADRLPDARKKILAGFKIMEANLSAGQFRQWFENSQALPPVRSVALLTGYARSGTTLLEQVLDAHPDIVSAEETAIFVDDALPPIKRGSSPDA